MKKIINLFKKKKKRQLRKKESCDQFDVNGDLSGGIGNEPGNGKIIPKFIEFIHSLKTIDHENWKDNNGGIGVDKAK